jgi:phosphoribosylformylglycinamidine synthase PurS subunit
MKFIAEIDVMPLKELLDPQGKAVKQALGQLGLSGVEDVRVGKHLRLTLEAADEATARQIVETACKQLLANPVMEHFSFSVNPA